MQTGSSDGVKEFEMDASRSSSIVIGLVLLIVGGLFLAAQLFPALGSWLLFRFDWPVYIILAGVVLLLIGLVSGVPAMAVPASIIGGIGGLLYWQNATGNWESWAYAWTLIPGFVGVGIILAGLLGESPRTALRDGGGMIVFSLVLFVIFGTFLGGLNLLGPFWPVLLILLGLWLLLRPMFRSRAS